MSRVDSLLYSSSETRQVSELLKIGRCVYLYLKKKKKFKKQNEREEGLGSKVLDVWLQNDFNLGFYWHLSVVSRLGVTCQD